MKTRFVLWLPALALLVCSCGKGVDKQAVKDEAVDNLSRIARGAVAYYRNAHADSRGNRLPPQFPDAVGPTPSEIPCDGEPHEGAWDNPSWEVLGFYLSEPHYLSYAFEAGGTPENPTFTASALIRLDCDSDPVVFTCTAGPGDSIALSPEDDGFDEQFRVPPEFAE